MLPGLVQICADCFGGLQYSWIPSQYPGEGEACLFDKNLGKKPAYTAVASLLQSAATAGLRNPAIVTSAEGKRAVATAWTG